MTDNAAHGRSTALAPLEGVRIVDFSSNIAGPFATMILAQLGADVIKVEPPTGDDARVWSVLEGTGLVHSYVNAGKRGVVLDLKSDEGRAAALRLCATADVVLQSMRPGVAKRLGLDPETLLAANPDLLCYDLNGYGTGPTGQSQPGYDPLVQADCGIISMNGHDGDAPSRCAPSVIDLGTGQWVALGIMAAIMSKRMGKPVNRMETALADTAFSLVAYQATAAKLTGERPPRAGSGNPIAAPYQCFTAKDGDILVAAPSQRLWQRATQALGAAHLLDDPRFSGPRERVAHRHELEAELAGIISPRTVGYWLERFRDQGVPAAAVAGLDDAVNGVIAKERKTFQNAGETPLVRLPWLVDGKVLTWVRPAPDLGEHTEDVMSLANTQEEDANDMHAQRRAQGAAGTGQ